MCVCFIRYGFDYRETHMTQEDFERIAEVHMGKKAVLQQGRASTVSAQQAQKVRRETRRRRRRLLALFRKSARTVIRMQRVHLQLRDVSTLLLVLTPSLLTITTSWQGALAWSAKSFDGCWLLRRIYAGKSWLCLSRTLKRHCTRSWRPRISFTTWTWTRVCPSCARWPMNQMCSTYRVCP